MRSILALAFLWAGLALADSDVRLPPGTRKAVDGQWISARGLRDTTDFIAKELEHRGITCTQLGPYRARGAELTRFVSTTAKTPWLAIHVLRSAGKTLIFFVARPSS